MNKCLQQRSIFKKYNISMMRKHCPPGYVLQDSSFTTPDSGLSCVCDTDDSIANCEPDIHSVLLKVCHVIVM